MVITLSRPFHALFSVSDKTGLVDLAKQVSRAGGTLVSTGGTAKTLREGGLTVKDVADVTGYPEMMDGRVKTMHPRITGGILARRDVPGDLAAAQQHGIPLFDMVVVNLYPFEQTVAKGAPLAEVIEQIDIGGPTLIRSAAKNYHHVAIVTSPSQYAKVASELAAGGGVTLATRERLAADAFATTARYDTIINQYFRTKVLDDEEDFPGFLSLSFEKIQDLRYGENSHQRAAFYKGKPTSEPSIVNSRQIHGKELSYNNLIDADTAIEAVKEHERPACVIIKHATPSGIACGAGPLEAFTHAYECDTYSPFGGVISFNRAVDAPTAEALGKLFLELVIAPGFTPEALAILTQKKSLRLIEIPGLDTRKPFGGLQIKSVVGGLVIQDRDIKEPDVSTWKVVSKVQPTKEQMRDMLFAFKAVRHVRSNSVLFAKDEKTVAIGGGQTARVDATRIAVLKGGAKLRGSVMASDAFFPFRDGVDEAAETGVAAIVHPGGSIRDAEVIQAADEHGIAMVFTGQRCFRH
ncbi:MAG TPA: bifunctional phosphoribosylaminoimidazolecarboxamide formyltransferase/IMP cyclohydrolase [Candidatus Thermoplasmatota archaeon]|nr:bifunctional phosphoribosylaminoimidazolecarboxamide formyltransferase/IMP cyclohydrolase [Candidatus Thermoplasmatota archaeon]